VFGFVSYVIAFIYPTGQLLSRIFRKQISHTKW